MGIAQAAALFALAAGVGLAQPLPSDLRSTLAARFALRQDDFQTIESGEPFGKLISGDRPDDLQLLGVILIHTDPERFIRAYKDIVRFEASKEVRLTGKFSDPPKLSDLNGFHVPDLDPKVIQACRPGDCAFKVPAKVMTEFQTKIDWSRPDSKGAADALVRQTWIDYLNRYRQQGDSALAVYYDTPNPFPVADGLKQLIGGLTVVTKALPDLTHYLLEYPNSRPPSTEEFFYWQEAAFGLKPVVRTSHVIIQKLPRPGDPHYVIASKMLFATHYFRAAIEFKYVYPVRTPGGQPAVYLIAYQRSYVDGMTGLTGSLLRRIVPGRSQASLTENLRLAKERLEQGK
jgi:hypothetical protein